MAKNEGKIIPWEETVKASEEEPLKDFARKVIAAWCWGDSMDGMDIQDLAEKLNLIEPHVATEDDVYEESDFEVGDMIYKFTDILRRSKD